MITAKKICRTISNYGDWSTELLSQIKQSCPDPKLIVFDFDLTITKKHTNGGQYLPVNPKERYAFIMNNLRSITIIRDFILYLKEQKINVAIASYADDFKFKCSKCKSVEFVCGKELIKEYLKVIFNSTTDIIPDNAILAFKPGTFSENYYNVCNELQISPWTYDLTENQKNIHLHYLARLFGLNYNMIVLIDDDNEVIKCAKKKFHALNVTELIVF
jgi:hypothetical protein